MSQKGETLRQSLVTCLQEAGRPLGYRELSVMLCVSEKDLPEHIQHVAKSLRTKGRRLIVHPAQCRSCGFTFELRKKITHPSRCPHCRSERIDPPVFSVE